MEADGTSWPGGHFQTRTQSIWVVAGSGVEPVKGWRLYPRDRGLRFAAMSMRRMVVLGLMGALALAGCGGSTKSGASTTSAAPATTAVTLGPQTLPPTTVAGANPFTVAPVPVVTGGTDLSKEPTIAAGTAPAPTTLVGQDLVVGTGAMPAASSTVMVQYVGALYDTGKVFDASWTDQGPASFPVSGVVPGFRDALLGMKVGGRREVVIPPALGYGARGSPPAITPNATLVFVIDLLSVSP